MKLEKPKVTYPHPVDSKNGKKEPLSRTTSVQPNESLSETINGLGNPGRLNVSYTVGKNPKVSQASHAQIEGLRPAKSEMKNG